MTDKTKLLTALGLMSAIAVVEALGGRLVVVGDDSPEKPDEGICDYQATKMEKAQAKRQRKLLLNKRLATETGEKLSPPGRVDHNGP